MAGKKQDIFAITCEILDYLVKIKERGEQYQENEEGWTTPNDIASNAIETTQRHGKISDLLESMAQAKLVRSMRLPNGRTMYSIDEEGIIFHKNTAREFYGVLNPIVKNMFSKD